MNKRTIQNTETQINNHIRALVASWMNGNRQWVIGQIEESTPRNSIHMAVEVYKRLPRVDAEIFCNILETHAVTELGPLPPSPAE